MERTFVMIKPEASEGLGLIERTLYWGLHMGAGLLALLAASGNFEEIPMHVRATARTGASKRDVLEAFQHVAIYAGEWACRQLGEPVVVTDGGFYIEALNGFPGPALQMTRSSWSARSGPRPRTWPRPCCPRCVKRVTRTPGWWWAPLGICGWPWMN